MHCGPSSQWLWSPMGGAKHNARAGSRLGAQVRDQRGSKLILAIQAQIKSRRGELAVFQVRTLLLKRNGNERERKWGRKRKIRSWGWRRPRHYHRLCMRFCNDRSQEVIFWRAPHAWVLKGQTRGTRRRLGPEEAKFRGERHLEAIRLSVSPASNFRRDDSFKV